MTTTIATREYIAAALLLSGFLLALIPALLTARTQVRDNLRIDDITNLRRAVEFYSNAHGHYPTPPPGTDSCTTADDSESWLFGTDSPLVKELHIDAIPHDVREKNGHTYTYCAKDIQNNQAQGYILETQLEFERPDEIARDEDERRKFSYRVYHEGENIMYRTCGGSDKSCYLPSELTDED